MVDVQPLRPFTDSAELEEALGMFLRVVHSKRLKIPQKLLALRLVSGEVWRQSVKELRSSSSVAELYNDDTDKRESRSSPMEAEAEAEATLLATPV